MMSGSRLRRIAMLPLTAAAIILVAVAVWRDKGQERVVYAGAGTSGTTPSEAKALEEAAFKADPEFFSATPKPGPQDWLAGPGRKERHRSFESYVRSSPPGRTAKRRTVVFQPLGEFTGDQKELIEQVRRYTEIFFGTVSRVEKAVPLPERGARALPHGGGERKQYLTGAIMDDVLLPRLPEDAICSLGVTMGDLYPQASWNFVFGQASLRRRVGVQSFARYSPEFYGRKSGPDARKLLLMRSVKVVVHETGHMFGLHHCRRYQCVENGSNHLGESDAQPVFLCPDCLRKLHWNLGFDPVGRYEKMLAFWDGEGFDEESAWLRRRLKVLRGAKEGAETENEETDP